MSTSLISFYSTVTLVGTSVISLLALLFQRTWGSTRDSDGFDRMKRIYEKPHQDYRFPRIIWQACVVTLVTGYQLALSVTEQKANGSDIVKCSLVLGTCLYLVTLTWISKQYRLPNWWGGILNIHLFLLWTLTFCSTICRFCLDVIWKNTFLDLTLDWITVLPWLILLMAQLDLVIITGTVPYDYCYLDESRKSGQQQQEIIRNYNCSILGGLLFNYVTNFITTASKYRSRNELLPETELPGLPPAITSLSALQLMNQTRDNASYTLLRRLFVANRATVFSQGVCSTISATFFYVPALVMQQLLLVIEEMTKLDREKQNDRYMQLYVLAILWILAQLAYIVISEVLYGKLYYYGHVLAISVRAMLNVEIYRKTLLRSNNATATIDGETLEENDDDDGDQGDDDSMVDNSADDEPSKMTATTGNIINLMSSDASSISDYVSFLFLLWGGSIEIITGLFILYSLLGKSSLAGVAVLIASMPISHCVAKVFTKNLDDIKAVGDRRGSVIHEVLRGIRQIKFYAWEHQWKERIMDIRRQELKHRFTIYLCILAFEAIWEGLPLVVVIVAFWSFTVLEGKELTPSVAFTSMFIYSELKVQFTAIPEHVVELLQALVSLRRIDTYLKQDDLTQVTSSHTPHKDENSTDIGFVDATLAWTLPSSKDTSPSIPDEETTLIDITTTDGDAHRSEATFKLRDINVIFPPNELSLICGNTGSGKTLMIMALLGEAPCTQGSVLFPRQSIDVALNEVCAVSSPAMVAPNSMDDDTGDKWLLDSRVAYVSQTPWLQNASIRDNILFGLPFIKERYDSTLWACSLVSDLEMFEDHDQTEIGERGINLSGGQKARVALARAVYSRAKIVLMDDVLSAVDAHTAKHLYDHCLTGSLMQNRTRILISHHLQLCLQQCSYLVHLQNGQVDIQGSPSDLRQTGSLNAIVSEEFEMNKSDDNDAVDEISDKGTLIQKKQKDGAARVLVEKEFRAQGHIKFHLYTHYLRLVGGILFWTVLGFVVFTSRYFDVMATWWLKQWSSIYEKASQADYNPRLVINNGNTLGSNFHDSLSPASSISPNNGAVPVSEVEYYLGIYAIITVLCILLAIGKFAVTFYGGLRASRKIFEDLLDRILHAPLRFFDTTPVGRILNRFSSDISTIDAELPEDTIQFIKECGALIAIFIAIIVVTPWFTVPAIFILGGTYYFGSKYISASRECKRIQSVTKSPLFSHFTETIVGITTIRAFGLTQTFLQTMLLNNDDHLRPLFVSNMVNRWISIRFAYLGAVIVLCSGGLLLISLQYNGSAALVGFIFSYALTFADGSFWTAYRYRRIEISYNSVERVVEFLGIDQESDVFTTQPPSDWPSRGTIEVKDLEIQYAPDLDMILKGISFSVGSGEKIGVVGKTGCGKSTLILSIFRFLEAVKGKIIIDDIDISTVALKKLRSRLTIIPQDPILVSGTLRSNLDPFDDYDDTSMLDSLRRVQLIQETSSSLPATASASASSFSFDNEDTNQNIFENLDSVITEGGNNISQGQRQLLCLARSLLKKTKIVIMDEATSSVDFETDKAIQRTMATEFAACTILCVAHRLDTVVGHDRVLVMDAGKVVEFDRPLTLINNPQSAFHKLCVNSGHFDQLLAAAQKEEIIFSSS